MQKELILVLLGIIGTSFLSSFLSGYSHTESDKVLLDIVIGVVGAGNFSYWQLGHNGPLLIELTSLYGDADLYISDNIRPSYEVDKNNFSSTTCGKDTVHIPTDFPRPIGLGVFGHWSHELSEYSIKVYLDAPVAIEERMVLTASGDIKNAMQLHDFSEMQAFPTKLKYLCICLSEVIFMEGFMRKIYNFIQAILFA